MMELRVMLKLHLENLLSLQQGLRRRRQGRHKPQFRPQRRLMPNRKPLQPRL
jgi:hypothetical protein